MYARSFQKALSSSVYWKAHHNFSTTALCRLKVGDKASESRTFTQDDVKTFANVTGDHNPIHLDPEYAKTSRFGKPIIHGTLTLGLISAIVARDLPGPGSVLLKQTIEYPAPLYVGEEVQATVELVRCRMNLAKLELLCTAPGGKVVLKGSLDVLCEAK